MSYLWCDAAAGLVPPRRHQASFQQGDSIVLEPWTPGLPCGLKNAYRERSDRPLMRVGFREHEIAQTRGLPEETNSG